MRGYLCAQRSHLRLVIVLAIVAAAAISARGEPAEWTDGFETYPVGEFPTSNWTNSGNTEAYVTNTVSESGSNSLYLYGLIDQDWAALAYRQYTATPSYVISFDVDNGSEALSGIHAAYGEVQLNTGPDWTTPGINLISFGDDGLIHAANIPGPDSVSEELDGPSLGSYASGTWYDVQIQYQTVNAGTYSLSYTINGKFDGTYDETSISEQSSLSYLGLVSGAGSAWFDNVSVTPIASATSSAVPLPSAAWSSLAVLVAMGLLRFRGSIGAGGTARGE